MARFGIPKETLYERKRVALAPAGVDALVIAVTLFIFKMEQAKEAILVMRNIGKPVHKSSTCRRNFYKSWSGCKSGSAIRNWSGISSGKPNSFSFYTLQSVKEKLLINYLRKKLRQLVMNLIEEEDRLPVLHSMSEIAGQLSIQVAERYLESFTQGGRGILLG